MSSTASDTAIPRGYAAAREALAHRLRPAGVLDVTGVDRETFLQGQLTQDVRGLALGDSRAAAGLTAKGKLLFVARVVGLEDRLRRVVPDTLRQRVGVHIRTYAVFAKGAVEDRSADLLRIGLYGREAPGLELPGGMDRLPGEGELSSHLLVPAGRLEELEAHLSAAGSVAVSADAAEVLRVEAGRPRYGTDMDESNLPDEVGMNDAISTTKGCYVGQEVVARLRTYGRLNRRLVFFRFPDGPLPAGSVLGRPGEESPARTEAGRVTSSVVSPRLGPIGLGYAFHDVASGARLVSVASPGLSAIVSDRPTA